LSRMGKLPDGELFVWNIALQGLYALVGIYRPYSHTFKNASSREMPILYLFIYFFSVIWPLALNTMSLMCRTTYIQVNE
jgi:hypothetical protein